METSTPLFKRFVDQNSLSTNPRGPWLTKVEDMEEKVRVFNEALGVFDRDLLLTPKEILIKGMALIIEEGKETEVGREGVVVTKKISAILASLMLQLTHSLTSKEMVDFKNLIKTTRGSQKDMERKKRLYEIEELDGLIDSIVVAFGLLLRFNICLKDLQINLPISPFGHRDDYIKLVLVNLSKIVDGEIIDHNMEYFKNTITTTCYQYIAALVSACIAKGYQWEKAFDLIHENNMSKFCSTEEEAKETVALYPDTTYEQRGDIFVILDVATKKIRKPRGYVPVDLAPCFGI